ncbi:MAG: DUF2459 domain-containing protein [Acidiferrobacter sp.]
MPGAKRQAARAARYGARRHALAPAIAVTILLLGACARPSVRALPAHGLASGPPLGVLREGWHTGLVVPETRLSGALRPLRVDLAGDPFAVIGWGERRYYMARHPGPLTGLAALFPSRSVVYVKGWRPRPADTQHVIWLRLTPRDWRGLRGFLGRTLAHTAHGGLEALGAHGHRGLFFASTDTYDAFHTCNTWTMQAMRAAHLPATSAGILFAGQVSAALHARPLRRFRDKAPRVRARRSSTARERTSPVPAPESPRLASTRPIFPRSPRGSFLDKQGSVTY